MEGVLSEGVLSEGVLSEEVLSAHRAGHVERMGENDWQGEKMPRGCRDEEGKDWRTRGMGTVYRDDSVGK